ncbi:hypothetical protein Hanom_Chr01g00056121 [Helianthus anomalus]
MVVSGGTRRSIQGYPKFFYDTFIEHNFFYLHYGAGPILKIQVPWVSQKKALRP